MSELVDIRGLYPQEIKEILIELGEKPFRGAQVFSWVQDKAVQSWHEMVNISKDSQSKIAQRLKLEPLRLVKERISTDGTRKYLWQLADGAVIESVLLYHSGEQTKERYTLCLSTQVGCPMGCSFCATGKLGYGRNLTVGEIVGQVLDLTKHGRREDPTFKINNLVYMGMGEPLLNLKAVVKSIRLLNNEAGQNIGIRRITVSTCGLVPQILELAQEKLDLVLAISLHAPTNALRDQIMPVNKQYPLESLLDACRRYIETTRRRITFEYALVKGFNDGPLAQKALAGLLGGISANVNVIPVNNVNHGKFIRPSPQEIRAFVEALRRQGLQVVVREEKGTDIEAACGQLAGTYSSP